MPNGLPTQLAEVDKVHITPLFKERWLRWEAGEDEPDVESASELAYALGVSVKWLFTDTEPAGQPARKRFQADVELRPATLLASSLKAARLAAGLTHKDVALLIGRHNTPSKLARFEAGKGEIDAGPYALALSILLGVPLETIVS